MTSQTGLCYVVVFFLSFCCFSISTFAAVFDVSFFLFGLFVVLFVCFIMFCNWLFVICFFLGLVVILKICI